MPAKRQTLLSFEDFVKSPSTKMLKKRKKVEKLAGYVDKNTEATKAAARVRKKIEKREREKKQKEAKVAKGVEKWETWISKRGLHNKYDASFMYHWQGECPQSPNKNVAPEFCAPNGEVLCLSDFGQSDSEDDIS